MNYVREINFVVLVLLLIALAILTGLAYLLTRSDIERGRMGDKIERMEKAHAEEIKQLHAEKADALEALADCQETCKALERQTVEVEAVKPATKRNSKGQFAKKVESE